MRLCLLSCITLLLSLPVLAAELSSSDATQLSQAQNTINAQQPAQAIEPLKQLIQKYPDLAQAHRLLGHAYAMTGQSQLAREHLVIAITHGQLTTDTLARLYQLDQTQSQHLANLAQLLWLSMLDPTDKQYPMLLAQTHESLNNQQVAQSLYESQLHQQPGNVTLLLKLANIAIKDNRYEQAIVYMETAIRLDATPHAIMQTLSWLYDQVHQPAQALHWHEMAYPDLSIANAGDKLQRARLLWNVDDIDAAMHLTQMMVNHAQLPDQALMLMAQIAIKTDRKDIAQQCFEKLTALGQAPANITAYLGSIAFNASDFASAARYLALSDKQQPLKQEQLHCLIISYLKLQDANQSRRTIQIYLQRFGLDEMVQHCINDWVG